MRIAITGATGLLGSHLSLCALARGHEVVAVVRSPHKAAWLQDLGVTIARADLAEPDALQAGFEGCDAVLANAARLVRAGGSWAEATADNEVGTGNQLRAAHAAGVQRVVYVSTIAVYTSGLWDTLSEASPVRREGDRGFDPFALFSSRIYSLTKAAAERRAWVLADELALDLTVLRPGPIYGPGSSRLNDFYTDALRKPHAFVPGVAVPHVHVADCAEAAIGCLTLPHAIGEAYNLAGVPTDRSTVLRALAQHTGASTRVWRVPVPLGLKTDDSKVCEQILNRPLRDPVDCAQDMLEQHPAEAAHSLYGRTP